MEKFKFGKQFEYNFCGPACLWIIAKYYGKTCSTQMLCNLSSISRSGTTLQGLSEAAESIGMRTMGVCLSFENLASKVILPCIAYWRQNHFIIIYKIKRNKIYVADPNRGLIRYSKEKFLQNWISTRNDNEDKGICLLIEPSHDFCKEEDGCLTKSGFKFLFSNSRPYKKLIVQLLVGTILLLIIVSITVILFL